MATVGQRRAFKHDGQDIYEWEQSLEEVNIFIKPPPGVTAQQIQCDITVNHVTLGLHGVMDKFLNHDLSSSVVVAESYWMLDSGELNINLQKMKKGFIWPSVFVGHGELDPMAQETTKQQMMLERFQEENPGFDFSNAEFNGAAPDPRTFMGGVKKKKLPQPTKGICTDFQNWLFIERESDAVRKEITSAALSGDAFPEKLIPICERVHHILLNLYHFSMSHLLIKNLKRAKRQMDKKARSDDAVVSALDTVLGSYDFFPVTYILPGEYAIFVEEFKRNQGVWIMKPIGKAQGKGIFLFTKLSQISDWRTDFRWRPENQQVETYVVQRYISNPYLVGGKKFDLRLYALVPSFLPLEVYLFRGGFARFTNSRYSNNSSDIANSFIHLTNVAVQKTSENYNKKHGGKWDLRNLKLYMMSKHGTERTNKLFHDIQLVIIKSLLSVEKIIMNDKHCFELYGYDVMIDENLKPWLLEVNASPSVRIEVKQLFFCA
ncbi:hypothetical protein BBJ29_001596 [Phytophthora kernoviae]|uniref:Tubulin--tyrosine ligase-like protein 9 n=1 Tax=Phytophthora kernoviae TaxID=325452 RepID=A0A3R7GMC5_9STRA|nr:hypothetical protein BBJ29_001596 [Phytophthora kernoviae]